MKAKDILSTGLAILSLSNFNPAFAQNREQGQAILERIVRETVNHTVSMSGNVPCIAKGSESVFVYGTSVRSGISRVLVARISEAGNIVVTEKKFERDQPSERSIIEPIESFPQNSWFQMLNRKPMTPVHKNADMQILHSMALDRDCGH